MTTQKPADAIVQEWFDSCWPIGKWLPMTHRSTYNSVDWTSTINSRGCEGEVFVTLFMIDGRPPAIRIDGYRKQVKAHMFVSFDASKTEFERAMQTVIDWVGPSLDDIIDDHFRPAMDLDFLKEEE